MDIDFSALKKNNLNRMRATLRETWQSGYSEIRNDILREFLKHYDRSNFLKVFTPTDVLYADYDLWCNEIIKGLDERLLYTDDEFESAVLDLLDDDAYIDCIPSAPVGQNDVIA